jgi:hypothetical protein
MWYEKIFTFSLGKGLLFLQLMNQIHKVMIEEKIDHFPGFGTMCTGSVSKDGLFNAINNVSQ